MSNALEESSEEIRQLYNFIIRDLEAVPYSTSSFHDSVKMEVDQVFEKYYGPDYKKLDYISLLMASCLAHITDRDIYKFSYVYLTWTLLFDDALERKDDSFIDRWMNKFKVRHADENTYLDHLFNYFIKGWETYAPIGIIDKAIQDIVDWTALFASNGSVDQILDSLVQQNQSSNYDKYFEARLLDIGSRRGFTWIELTLGENLIEIRKDAQVNEVLKHFDHNTGLGIVVVNDVFSFKKEIKQNRFKYNYVYIKMKNEGLSVQQSVDAIVSEIKHIYSLMHEYGEQLKKFEIPVLTKYVDIMYRINRDAVYWSSVCSRYNDLDQYE